MLRQCGVLASDHTMGLHPLIAQASICRRQVRSSHESRSVTGTPARRRPQSSCRSGTREPEPHFKKASNRNTENRHRMTASSPWVSGAILFARGIQASGVARCAGAERRQAFQHLTPLGISARSHAGQSQYPQAFSGIIEWPAWRVALGAWKPMDLCCAPTFAMLLCRRGKREVGHRFRTR